MDRVTEYLTHSFFNPEGDGCYYLFSEIETELTREVIISSSEGPAPFPGARIVHSWVEVARIDPELETATGPCPYWQGKGIAFDTVKALSAYITWKRSEEPPADDIEKPLTFVKVTRTMLEEGSHCTDLDTLVEDNDGKS